MIAPLLLIAAFEIDPPVEKALAEWGAPGVAVAVVKDGKVVSAKGYGVRKVGESARIDEHTVFQFGSLTKGFTAFAVALLASEGKLAFDDPVTKHVPAFTLADATLAKQLTLRDLLAHRTGLQPELDWLWAAGKNGLSRAALLDRLRFAKAATPLRDGFSYHNVTYTVLGEAISKAAGAPWERVIAERVFSPLGMKDASLGAAAFAGAKNVATPHDDAQGPLVPTAALDGDAVGPAASANGSISDLAAYLLHMLRAPKEIEAVTAPQSLMPLGTYSRKVFEHSHLREYGMGWVLQDHRGRLVVWNTGGMNGQSCSIAFLPEEHLGIAVLTNQPRTSLPEAIVFELIDRALQVPHQDWSAVRLAISKEGRAKAKQEEQAVPAERSAMKAASAYVGRYDQPLLGEVQVTSGAKGLEVRFAGTAGDARHLTGDRFRVMWRTPSWGSSLLEFKERTLELEDAGTFVAH